MSRFYVLLFFVFAFNQLTVFAQQDTAAPSVFLPVDSVPVIDSAVIKDSLPSLPLIDSFSRKPFIKDTGWSMDPSLPLHNQILQHHPYFPFGKKSINITSTLKQKTGKDSLFYLVIGVLLLFALLKNAFSKYFADLLRLFFRRTMKQRQLKDQLTQTPLPSLLFNLFFFVSAGLYINFLLLHFQLIRNEDFWIYYFYCMLGLAAIYLVKYAGLKVLGWIFNLNNAADAYIFIVFIVNKMIGIFLLPFIVILAFTSGNFYIIGLTLSWIGIGVLIFYRFILTYAAVRNQIKFNIFHFFLYLFAFEIAPLLLIYKLLLILF